MTPDEFYDLLTMISKGEATTDELKDGLAYCAGTSLETGKMFRALVDGYEALTAAVARKDQKLRAARDYANSLKRSVRADVVSGPYGASGNNGKGDAHGSTV